MDYLDKEKIKKFRWGQKEDSESEMDSMEQEPEQGKAKDSSQTMFSRIMGKLKTGAKEQIPDSAERKEKYKKFNPMR